MDEPDERLEMEVELLHDLEVLIFNQAFCLQDTTHYAVYSILLKAFYNAKIFNINAIQNWSDSDPLFEINPRSIDDFRFQNYQWIRSLCNTMDWLAPDLTLCDSACDCTAFSDEALEQPSLNSNSRALQWADKRKVREFCKDEDQEVVDEYQECDSEVCECCSDC
jgi:hypothetical protein